MYDLVVVPVGGEYYVNRLEAGAVVPEPGAEELWSLTRTSEETSVVCAAAFPHARAEGPWSAFRVTGTLDFALTGILHRILGPLASAQVSVFSLSTFDTDYVLVPADRLVDAIDALRSAGHSV